MDASDWDSRYSATDTMWTEQPNTFLVEKVEGLKPGRALDMGCGEGRNALWLAERGWSVTAVDFSEVAVERGRDWADRRGLSVEFLVADLTEFDPEPLAYDLVILFYIQLKNDDVRNILERAVGAVAKGGSLLVVAHDLDNLEHGYGGPPTPGVLYTTDLVLDSIGALSLVEAGRVKRSVATPEGEQVAIDTLVLARRTVPVTSRPA